MTLKQALQFAPFSRFARVSVLLRLLLACGTLTCGVTPRVSTAADRQAIAAALGSIRAKELQKHVEVLADDSFEGREAGTRGGRAAGGYLAERFQKAGLAGGGDNGGFFQVFGNGYRNLLGLLEGSDPELKKQVLIVGAHYDHVGYGNRRTSLGPIGYIHNGADDNASGIACLLEIVDAFKVLGIAPRRSILFALWDGEEQGLLGSRHWVTHPTVPLNQIVLALNSDMVGRLRDNRVEVLGTRTGTGLRLLTARANTDVEVDIDFNWEMKPNSDHHSFFAKNIPVLMLHSGLHDDYHRPSDDVEKVNSDGMERLGRYWFQVALELADADKVTRFRPQSQHESPTTRKQFETPLAPPPPRLGITYRKPAAGDGIELTSITPNSAGARAGLRVGDRIVRIGETPIDDEDQLRLEILAARSPLKLAVQRVGNDDPIEISAAIPGNPSRIGLWWREDDAEPATLIVNLVIPGSAAARAGVQHGDRIIAIASEPIQDTESVRKLLAKLPGPIPLEIERQGKLRTIMLEPLPPAVAEIIP